MPTFAPITSEIAKLEFKLEEHGLRRDSGRSAVSLAAPAPEDVSLALFRERRTHRDFGAAPVSFHRFGRVLAALMDQGAAQRRYLSPGGAYPVEIHVQVRQGRVEGIEAGIYRYDPVAHRLELTTPHAEVDARCYEAVNESVARQAAFGIFLLGRPEALVAAYGQSARESALLEAGSLGQLLMEIGPDEGIGFCPIGGIAFDEVRGLFGADPSCVLLHSFLGGGIGEGRAAGDGGQVASTAEELPRLAADEPACETAAAHVDGDFLEDRLSSEAFGHLLSALRQVRLPEFPFPKYRYASAGALYPVQVYVAVEPGRIQGVDAGVYYYHPREHRLLRMADGVAVCSALTGATGNLPAGPAFSLFLIGRLGAIAPLYGAVARDFCLLEAGYMSQLLTAAGGELGVGLVPAACADFRAIRGSFALQEDHVLLHALVCGAVAVQATVRTAPGPRIHESAEDAARIRGRLAEVLPEYMVPSQVVFLDELPLTANGKVDRQGLPVPGEAGERETPEAAAPRSDLEMSLARLWSEVLGQERVGVHDNFFAIGGTSLHMIQLRNRLLADLGFDVRITEFFKYPTIALLAQSLSPAAEAVDEALDKVDEQVQRQKQALQQQRKMARDRRRAQ